MLLATLATHSRVERLNKLLDFIIATQTVIKSNNLLDDELLFDYFIKNNSALVELVKPFSDRFETFSDCFEEFASFKTNNNEDVVEFLIFVQSGEKSAKSVNVDSMLASVDNTLWFKFKFPISGKRTFIQDLFKLSVDLVRVKVKEDNILVAEEAKLFFDDYIDGFIVDSVKNDLTNIKIILALKKMINQLCGADNLICAKRLPSNTTVQEQIVFNGSVAEPFAVKLLSLID